MKWILNEHAEATSHRLYEINGSRSTPILPHHWVMEHVALAILLRAGRHAPGRTLALAVWMQDHMRNGRVEVSEDNLIAMGFDRTRSRGAAIKAA